MCGMPRASRTSVPPMRMPGRRRISSAAAGVASVVTRARANTCRRIRCSSVRRQVRDSRGARPYRSRPFSAKRSCTAHVATSHHAPASPDANAVRRREVERLARLHVERRVPGVEVAHGVGAVLGRRVAVGQRCCWRSAGSRIFVRQLWAKLRKNCWSPVSPCDGRRLLAAEREAVGVVGRGEPGDVGDVLAQRQLAVDGEVGERAGRRRTA